MTDTPDLSPLFAPFTCKTMRLRNRIVMSPMTRQFAPDGVLDGAVDDYYERRAAGGTGLIITEGTAVGHPVAHYSRNIPHFYARRAGAHIGAAGQCRGRHIRCVDTPILVA